MYNTMETDSRDGRITNSLNTEPIPVQNYQHIPVTYIGNSTSSGSWSFTIDSEIQVSFAKYERELAERYDTKIGEFYTKLSSMGNNGYWIGEDYNAFISGINEYKKALLDVGDSVRAYANHFENCVAPNSEELIEEVFQIIENITER